MHNEVVKDAIVRVGALACCLPEKQLEELIEYFDKEAKSADKPERAFLVATARFFRATLVNVRRGLL